MDEDDGSERAAKIGILQKLAADLAKLSDANGMAPAKIRIRVARGLSVNDIEAWADFDVYGQAHIAARRNAMIALWDKQRAEALHRSLRRRQ